MPKKKVNWGLFKKTTGVNFPGEFWEEYKTEREARIEFKKYDKSVFRLVKIIYENDA
jgi:hypothetical protein